MRLSSVGPDEDDNPVGPSEIIRGSRQRRGWIHYSTDSPTWGINLPTGELHTIRHDVAKGRPQKHIFYGMQARQLLPERGDRLLGSWYCSELYAFFSRGSFASSPPTAAKMRLWDLVWPVDRKVARVGPWTVLGPGTRRGSNHPLRNHSGWPCTIRSPASCDELNGNR